MRDLVTHLKTGIQLDLSDPDYGHPDGQEIIRSLHGHLTKSDPQLVCAKHGSPLYLQYRNHQQHGPRLWGIHFDGNESHQAHAGMSDEHKRQTDYLVRAAEDAGLSARYEVSLPTHVRPDAVIYGDLNVAIEVQRSHLKTSAAIGRTTKAKNGGMATSVWFNDSHRDGLPGWFWHVPSVAMNKLPWDVTPPRRAVAATTGVREIYTQRCRFPEYSKCPKTQGRPCGQWHVETRPWLGVSVDDIATLVPTGEMRPLRYLGKQIILVSRASVNIYEDVTGRPSQAWLNPHVVSPKASEGDPQIRVACTSPAEDGFLVAPVAAPQPIKGSSWAARNLGHLPGRCKGCGWHIGKQGHAPECAAPRQFSLNMKGGD